MKNCTYFRLRFKKNVLRENTPRKRVRKSIESKGTEQRKISFRLCDYLLLPVRRNNLPW